MAALKSSTDASTAIVVRGHERGATSSDGLFVALSQLCELLPDSSLFVRSWIFEDASPGSTWRWKAIGQPRPPARPRTLNQSRVCQYFDRGLLRSRLADCVLEPEPRSKPTQTHSFCGTKCAAWPAPAPPRRRRAATGAQPTPMPPKRRKRKSPRKRAPASRRDSRVVVDAAAFPSQSRDGAALRKLVKGLIFGAADAARARRR